ncbi:ABC transporter permease [Halobacterium salinarum]|uniref:ABC transporter permease n=1 Tax=Halobacterium salinarum TaxID=2242 RepID=UPI002554F85B|nr:ABC transporter permease [Halobacterium salinarum]MDL0119417.1 ABC transporter permease [Halobacterium salinarum]MDL0128289.1 ABC transporter permease [Halobacterium salinarum]
MPSNRFTAAFGLGLARLRSDRLRTIFAITGVTLAVLSTTLLGSLGVGVVDTGQQKFDAANRDLWVSGGPTRIAPGTVGGFESGIVDAHQFRRDVGQWRSVNTAAPLLFQTVYAGTESGDLQTVIAVGASGSAGFTIQQGTGFTPDAAFYNDGAYNGTRSGELLVGTELQHDLNASIGNTLHVGGTVVDARQTTYNITGVSGTFSQFLGTPTIGVPLAELQSMTGAQYTDRASLITVDVKDSASVTAVADRLREQYPEYTVRTNSEQLQAIVADRVLVLAAGGVLVVLAVLSGLALTINLLSLLVAQELPALAALRALGLSRTVISTIVAAQGIYYGVAGAIAGVTLTYPAAAALNLLARSLVGFDGLVQVTPRVLTAGALIAVATGVLSAFVAGWRASGVRPLDALSR